MVVPLLLITLGILVALTPHYIFPVCAYYDKLIETKGGGLVPMACTYTARAETIIGMGIVLIGLMLWLAKERETKIFLSALVVAKGLAIIATPEVVGYCKSPMMPCVSGTVPALRIGGAAVLILGLVGLFLELKSKKVKEEVA